MQTFACLSEKNVENSQISSYWWILVSSGAFWFTAAWANESSETHYHPPWGPALQKDILWMSYIHECQKEKIWIWETGFSPMERQTYWHYRAIISSLYWPLPRSGSCPSLLGSSSALGEPWVLRLTNQQELKGSCSYFCIWMKYSWWCTPAAKVFLTFIYVFILFFSSGIFM